MTDFTEVTIVKKATQSPGQIRSWSFRSNSFSDERKVLKIVYINNYYLYILSLGEKLFSDFDFDRNDHDRI